MFKDEYCLRENIPPSSSMPKLVFVVMETGSSRGLKARLEGVAENCQNSWLFMRRMNVLEEKKKKKKRYHNRPIFVCYARMNLFQTK